MVRNPNETTDSLSCACKKCKRQLPNNAVYCCWCGAAQLHTRTSSDLPEPVKRCGSWRIQITIGGRRRSFTADSKREVMRAAREARDHAEAVRSDASALTLAEAVERYITDREAVLSPSTIRGYKQIQQNRFKELMDVPVRDISSDAWQRAVSTLASKASPKTVRNASGLVVSAADKVCGVRLSAALPQRRAPSHAFLEPEQMSGFIEQFKDQRSEAAVLLGLHSLRLSEILGLRPEDIDLKRGTIRVSRAMVRDKDDVLVLKETTKTAASTRTIPVMIPRLKELLKAHPDALPVPLGQREIYADVKKACAAIGVDNVGIHGLRHSFASLCAHLGVPEQECMAIGGWSNPTIMREIYTHIAAVDKARSESALKDFFSDLHQNCTTQS